MIALNQLTKSIGSQAVLMGVDLTVAEGEHVLVTGPSGSGKSTLLELIAGLDAPSAGEVVLGGRTASSAGRVIVPPHQRRVAMVFQDLGLWPHRSVLGNVLIGLSGNDLGRKQRMDLATAALEEFALGSFASRFPRQLSAGQQQRVALARAFVCGPAIVLLDEPFAGLDLLLREEIFGVIRQRCRADGITTVTVSHNPDDAFALSVDRIVVIEEGRLCDSATLNELETNQYSSMTLQAWRRSRDHRHHGTSGVTFRGDATATRLIP